MTTRLPAGGRRPDLPRASIPPHPVPPPSSLAFSLGVLAHTSWTDALGFQHLSRTHFLLRTTDRMSFLQHKADLTPPAKTLLELPIAFRAKSIHKSKLSLWFEDVHVLILSHGSSTMMHPIHPPHASYAKATTSLLPFPDVLWPFSLSWLCTRCSFCLESLPGSFSFFAFIQRVFMEHL